MIPINMIKQWRQQAPWLYQSQVEQDLVLSRALVMLYQNDVVAKSLALRGGTALNKLFLKPSARYSEDIDFVQINDEPIGKIFSAIRQVLDPWLGDARWRQDERSAKLLYRFQSEDNPPVPLRLKIEINTTEFFTVYGYKMHEFSIDSRWYQGKANILTYELEELMGTKLRALYQRLKGRDLFDLWVALTKFDLDCQRILKSFEQYNNANKIKISRAEFEKNLALKIKSYDFLGDIPALLSDGADWDPVVAYSMVMTRLVSKLPGMSWKDLELFRAGS